MLFLLKYKLLSHRIENLSLSFFYYVFVLKLLFPWIQGFLLKKNQIYVYIDFYMIHTILQVLTLNSLMSIDSLIDVMVVDKSIEWITWFLNRFKVIYSFWNMVFGLRIFLVLTTWESSFLLSLTSFFSSSSWLEREIWDLFGIRFIIHDDMSRILTDYGFKGSPLCKHFPLMGWSEIRYDDVTQTIVTEKIELSQDLRFFHFESPWFSWR